MTDTRSIVDGAIAVHHTATVDTAWDGPAAVAAMPNDAATLSYCHAWKASDAGDEKGGYKFPHHKVKGGPANIPACRNGLARLSGADIPDGDRAGVKSHLQAHIDDANGGSDDRLPERLRARTEHILHARNAGNRDWFRIVNQASSTDVYLFDEIGYWGTSASDFIGQLQSLATPTLNVHINSPGGEVFDGLAIMNMLQSHPATVNIFIDGMAASIASVIAMAGDTVTIAPNAMLMIHEASGMCIGNAADMQQTAAVLAKISDNIAGVYATKTKTDATSWREMMQAETWFTGSEAVDAGLADRVASVEPEQGAAPIATDHWLNALGFKGARLSLVDAALEVTQALGVALEPAAAWDTEALREALRVPQTYDIDAFRDALKG